MENDRGGCRATADEHEIELMKQQLLPSMTKDIESAPIWSNESAGQSSCCIFRVPQGFAEGIAKECRPTIVSFGPYHHGAEQLGMLEGHKWGCLRTMLDQTEPHGVSLENLIDVVAPKEKMIRRCYSDSTDSFSGPDLVKMMILDGCFIIQFLRGLRGAVRTDPHFNNTSVAASIMWDLLRLENQLPYFVLEDLFETTNVPRGTLSLDDLAFHFFSSFRQITANVQERRNNKKGRHLLDLFHLSLMPGDQQDNPVDESSSFNMIRSASELRRVGIGFKQREASTIPEIKCDSKQRTIGIPKITIDDDLNFFLSNMVAFEQCRGQFNGYMTAYVAFMGCLLQTADDVKLLRDRKVISNHGMSNEHVASLFGEVWKYTGFYASDSYLASHFAILKVF